MPIYYNATANNVLLSFYNTANGTGASTGAPDYTWRVWTTAGGTAAMSVS